MNRVKTEEWAKPLATEILRLHRDTFPSTGGVKKLPDNFLVSSLQDLVNRQRPATSYPFCDICRMLNRRHRDAQAKCIDCSKLLCRMCSEQHRETRVTKHHSLIDIDTEKDIECKEHKDELVRFYCMPCETPICILCTVSDHKEHEIISFPEAVVRFKDDITASLDSCKDKLHQLEQRLTILGATSTNVEETEQVIRDAAINFISDIRGREKSLLEELRISFGGLTTEEIQKKKQELQTEVDSLRSTCSLAELVLKGRDLELLMLKKQVQEKLKQLGSIDTRTLFLKDAYRVEFIPGSVDLGLLQQIDPDDEKMSETESLQPSEHDKLSTSGLLVSGRLSRASMSDILQKATLTPPNFTRSSSYNFEVGSMPDKFTASKDKVALPGSIESFHTDVHNTSTQDSSTQTTPTNRRERGVTAIVLTDMKSKGCQVDPDDVEETFANLADDESNIVWLPGHLFEEDESAFSEQFTQTEIVEYSDAAVNTRCRVVQRQSNSGTSSATMPSTSPMPIQSTLSCGSDYNSVGSPRSDSSYEQPA